MPKHTPQPTPWSCQYYAMYQLFEDRRFLMPEHVDTNQYWFHRICRQYGYDVLPRYVDQTFTAPAPLSFWDHYYRPARLLENVGCEQFLLLDVGSRDLAHTVGVHVTINDKCQLLFDVYDSLKPFLWSYGLKPFLASEYGRAYAVWEVAQEERMRPLQPHMPGFDMDHVSPEVREAFLAKHHDYFVSLTRNE